MKKIFSILILVIFSQFQVLTVIAGTDGEVEISSKNIDKLSYQENFLRPIIS